MPSTLLARQSQRLIPLRAMSAVAPKKLELRVISDTICPFCYLGLRKIDAAIAQAKADNLGLDVSLKFEPFQLDPTLSADKPINKKERYAAKFGDRTPAIQAAMIERGKPYGIDFSFGGNMRQTTSSQRLLAHAYAKGGEKAQRALVERLFKGYFTEEQDIGDPAFLARAAVEANIGLTKDEVITFLQSDEGMADYNASLMTARAIGVSGVPFTIINNRLAVSGAQEPEDFLAAFKQAAAAA